MIYSSIIGPSSIHHDASSSFRTAIVLTIEDAERHAEYAMLRARIEKLPLGGNREYDLACYLRWLAMAAAGGGWMSDYDAAPLRFSPPPELPNGGAFTGYEGHVPS